MPSLATYPKHFCCIDLKDRLHSYAKKWLASILTQGSTAIDGTVGNGNDTLFLCETTQPGGKIFGFDVQSVAIETTEALLSGHGHSATLFLESHDRIETLLRQEGVEAIDGAIFNLGYLPGEDHKRTTQKDSTLSAVRQSLRLLIPGGRIAIVAYRGHPGGTEEENALYDFLSDLSLKNYKIIYSERKSKPEAPVFYGIVKTETSADGQKQ